VIIDFRKIIRMGSVFLLAAAVTIMSLYGTGEIRAYLRGAPEVVISQNISVIGSMGAESGREGYGAKILAKLCEVLTGFGISDGADVICGTIPVYAVVSNSGLLSIAKNSEKGVVLSMSGEEEEQEDTALQIPEENRAPIKSIDASQKISDTMPVAIANETSYGINISEMIASPPRINMSANGPKILITHTHATESYAPDGAKVYDITASDRSNDKTKNVVAVGRRMMEIFEDYGIETLHDETLHDVPSFNGSYAHSLDSITKYMEKYPSIQIVFDLHRDSIVYNDKTKARTVTEIEGEDAAQLMFVVGTDENGLHHPNWRENIRSAIWFQKTVADKYPKLMRHINLRRERFNGHTCPAAMIIEVGTSGNSLEEALYGIELAAKSIAELLTDER
ncbi:MAG: stage II sporulation protein P, partial [Clostridia bacterium]|nr:stage II sporulation protein P [Clostridia bacterium]